MLDTPQLVVIPCRNDDGEVLVVPPVAARHPVKAHWSGPQQMHPSSDTLRATRLRPGVYSVHIIDARGYASGVLDVAVPSAHVPTIVGYDVEHTTSDEARDGAVVARCEHVVAERAAFLWTNGAQTVGPRLSAVRPGKYAALVIETDGHSAECLHACAPAHVDVRYDISG